mgnify:CR=1 FL=1
MKNTQRQEKNKQDFSKLANLANQARAMRDLEALEDFAAIEKPLNYFIKKIYNLEGQELNTFTNWKKQGFMVKKGQKGHLFFSAPKTFKKEIENKAGQKEELKFNKFCKCFLFAQDQVEKID